jgi:hypothetical protein
MADETTTTETTPADTSLTKAQLQTELGASRARIAELEGRLNAAAGRIDELEGQHLADSRARPAEDPRDVMFGRLVGALEAQALLALAQRLFAQGASGQAERLVERAATLLG